MPTHETDSDGAIKKIKGQSKKYDIKKQEQDELSKLLKKQKDELNKFKTKKTKKKETDLDDFIKKLDEENKLLKQKNEQNKLLEQQNDELNKLLQEQKQEEDIDWDQINELSRKANELTKNINSRSPTNRRTFAPRRHPFDDINKNKKKINTFSI